MPNSYFRDQIVQKPALSSSPSLTPPVFGGPTSASAHSDGSIQVFWNSATTSTPPVRYRIYVYPGAGASPGDLLAPTSIAGIFLDPAVSGKVFTLGNGIHFVKGQVYSVTVKAEDIFGNIDLTYTGALHVTAIATGNLPDALQSLADDIQSILTDFTTTEAALEVTAADLSGTSNDLGTTSSDLSATESALAVTAAGISNTSNSLETTSTELAASANSVANSSTDLAESSGEIAESSEKIQGTAELLQDIAECPQKPIVQSNLGTGVTPNSPLLNMT
jgi:methyl-accepting chemotaxis protein